MPFERARRRPIITLTIVLAALAVFVGGTLAATAYTSRPSFCSSCHEMKPYYAAWDQGAHANVSCVECHVDPGIKAQVPHKIEALREVYVHFTSTPTFPQATVAAIPDSRCVSCHQGPIGTDKPGFSHETHRQGRACVECHSEVGHEVSPQALAEAGILNVEGARARKGRQVAAVGAGAANVSGHPTVTCTNCHDLAATGCLSCHDRDASDHPTPASVSTSVTADPALCVSCHSAVSWTFTHPTDPVDCASCHAAPAKHRPGVCAQCHTTGKTWTFAHPDQAATCTTCHTPPAPHSTKACATCHSTGVSWAFRHPASKDCSSCHQRPAKHYTGACSACHTPTTPFANATFRHPGPGATCTNCHKRPGGHSTSTCSSCHKTGVSWKFVHPTSKSCASCHKAPSGHYGTTCTSCHTPSKTWSSATFAHPKVPGGEHTYRSFACNKCHPSGYSSVNCTSCHAAGGDD